MVVALLSWQSFYSLVFYCEEQKTVGAFKREAVLWSWLKCSWRTILVMSREMGSEEEILMLSFSSSGYIGWDRGKDGWKCVKLQFMLKFF